MSRLMSRQQTSFSVASARRNAGGVKGKSKADVEREDKGMEAEAAMSWHIEQSELGPQNRDNNDADRL
jgi:hypothetical protein